MAHRHEIPDFSWGRFPRHMHDTTILNICPLSNPDMVDIAPNNRLKPDRAFSAYGDIANYNAIVSQKTGVVNRRRNAAVSQNHNL
jgi:hypothetical protein